MSTVMTPATIRRVPNQEKTPRRTIRVADDIWDAAARAAEARNESVSDVVRRALIRYAKAHRPSEGDPPQH